MAQVTQTIRGRSIIETQGCLSPNSCNPHIIDGLTVQYARNLHASFHSVKIQTPVTKVIFPFYR